MGTFANPAKTATNAELNVEDGVHLEVAAMAHR